MNEFLLMGGYGVYVWSSFLFCALVGGYQWLKPLVEYRRQRALLRRQWREEALR
ncbi:MAG: heme exporter protein CcmD [Thiomicrospira sp.]|jgi:heme exporter protein CcmD